MVAMHTKTNRDQGNMLVVRKRKSGGFAKLYYLVTTSDTKVVNSCNCLCDKECAVLPDPLFMQPNSDGMTKRLKFSVPAFFVSTSYPGSKIPTHTSVTLYSTQVKDPSLITRH